MWNSAAGIFFRYVKLEVSLTDLVFRVIFPRTHFAGKPEKKPNLSLSSLYISFGFTFINMLHSKKKRKKKRSKMHFSKYKNTHISNVFQKGKPHYRNLSLQQETWMHHITLSKRGGFILLVCLCLAKQHTPASLELHQESSDWTHMIPLNERAKVKQPCRIGWMVRMCVCGGCVCNVEGMVGWGWVVRGTLNFIAWQRPMLRQFLMYPLMC